MVKHISDNDFKAEVEDAKGLVLVDFWAPWCGPCQMVGPILEELAGELGDKLKICKIDIDENKDVAGRLGVMSIPSMFLYKDGKIVESTVGARDKNGLMEMISKYISE